MDSDDDLLGELEANKALFNSSFNAEQKVDAYRRQSIILDELASSSTESERTAIHQAHFNNHYTDEDSYKTFIEDRSKNVKKLLHGLSHVSLERILSDEEFLREEKSFLEPDCSEKYKSCSNDEVIADDLKMYQRILGNLPPSDLIRGCPQSFPVSEAQSNERQSNINQFFFTKSSSVQKIPAFRTAREELIIQNLKKNTDLSSSSSTPSLFNYGALKKSLGARRNVRSDFVPPVRPEGNSLTPTPPNADDATSSEPVDERLRNIDPKMVELISNEIMHKYKPISWNDIAGLEYAKATIKEAVVWPILRPDIFTGLRRPPRGILLFGPPGTGKTLIGKCIASQSKSTFFSISASSLTSKWVGDGEKMVRALFAVAAVNQPSVVFIDEIDSLLSQRSKSEDESSRRIKTEFLVQLDGAATLEDERILIVGATNRPQELDEAARRRLVRRLYIPLPELSARIQILTNLLETVSNTITKEEIADIGNLTGGYSGADMESLCREASMEPIRSIPPDEIPYFSEENVRPMNLNDFRSALQRVRASVSPTDLKLYEEWNIVYGAGQ